MKGAGGGGGLLHRRTTSRRERRVEGGTMRTTDAEVSNCSRVCNSAENATAQRNALLLLLLLLPASKQDDATGASVTCDLRRIAKWVICSSIST
jgi:hypothetical protein